MIKSIPSREPGEMLRLDRHRYTYDDLQSMPETMDQIEIIDGVLYMSPSAHVWRHQRAVGPLFLKLSRWVDERSIGEVFTAPADVVASPTKVVQPDVVYISTERLDIVDAYVDGAPDLVVEVVSPSSRDYDHRTEFDLYEEIGVREYWIVEPAEGSIEVYHRTDDALEEVGQFRVGHVVRSVLLDGFTVAVQDVLPDSKHSA